MNLRILKQIFIVIALLGACSMENASLSMKTIQSNQCDCTKTFQELVGKLESNYVGLALIKDTERLLAYKTLKEEYATNSKKTIPEKCTQFLNDFLLFFEDGHLSAFEYPNVDSLELIKNKLFLNGEAKDMDMINKLSVDQSDPIAGLWSDGKSIFRVVKNGDFFDAYLIKSSNPNLSVGALKLRVSKKSESYEGTYYQYDYNARFTKGDIYKENTALRMGPLKWDKISTETTSLRNVKEPKISKIDDETVLIEIPSFLVDYEDFKKFLKVNNKSIKNAIRLIIDIRGNTGGNSIYFPLIEHFATRTLKSSPGYVLVSDDNREYFNKNIGFVSSKIYSPLLERMSENGKVVEGPNYPDKDLTNPKSKIQRVSILIDRGCASAAESFILHSKGASDKVVTFGSPTRGMIDFTSVNSILLKNSGNQRIYFGYPTGTLNKEVMESGYNKNGILPDVPIAPDEDKIQFILDYYM